MMSVNEREYFAFMAVLVCFGIRILMWVVDIFKDDEN